MPFKLIQTAEAIRFDRVAEHGRNEPLRVTVETTDGNELEVFLKPSGRPEIAIEGMANELFAAIVAGHLGLPICKPIAVHMSLEWIESVHEPSIRAMLRASSPVAFGSVAAGSGWRRWTGEDRILGDRRLSALMIFTFDAFIENKDRIVRNPNLLVRGDEFRIIDHELCFRIRQCLFPRPEPWRAGYLNDFVAPGDSGHVFGSLLKGDRLLDFTPLKPAWISLSDDALSDYAASMPPEWESAKDAVQDAVTHLRVIRDRIDECLAEVERALK